MLDLNGKTKERSKSRAVGKVKEKESTALLVKSVGAHRVSKVERSLM